MRGLFWKSGFFRDLDFWICGKCSQAYYNISIFRFFNLEKIGIFVKMFDICSIYPAYMRAYMLAYMVPYEGVQIKFELDVPLGNGAEYGKQNSGINRFFFV